MMTRIICVPVLAFTLSVAAAENQTRVESIKALNAGPFEFPITGKYKASDGDGGPVLTTPDDNHRILVAFFRNSAATSSEKIGEQIAKVEAITRRNWEQFAAEQKCRLVRAFRRKDLAPDLVIFSMACEFKFDGGVQYYVTYAVTDGPQVATLFFEGFGSAAKVVARLDPTISRVKRRYASDP